MELRDRPVRAFTSESLSSCDMTRLLARTEIHPRVRGPFLLLK
jgi:hypothetical protein